jgi:hypothetical protein
MSWQPANFRESWNSLYLRKHTPDGRGYIESPRCAPEAKGCCFGVGQFREGLLDLADRPPTDPNSLLESPHFVSAPARSAPLTRSRLPQRVPHNLNGMTLSAVLEEALAWRAVTADDAAPSASIKTLRLHGSALHTSPPTLAQAYRRVE